MERMSEAGGEDVSSWCEVIIGSDGSGLLDKQIVFVTHTHTHKGELVKEEEQKDEEEEGSCDEVAMGGAGVGGGGGGRVGAESAGSCR